MKKTYLFAKVALLAVLFYFSACSPDQQEKPAPKTDQITIGDLNAGTIDPNMEIVAKSLAKSLSESSMREFIKTEASKHFDAAPDLLYSQIQKRVIDKVDFQHTLANNMASPGARVDAVNQLEEIASKIPLLNISVPVNLESWNPQAYTPLVAVCPSSSDFSHYKAFDKDGKVHWLDAEVEPTVPVIVVGLNERVSIDKKGTVFVKYYNSEAATKAACPGCRIDPGAGTNVIKEDPEGGAGGGGTTPTPTLCDRDKRQTKEELTKIKFSTMKDFREAEKWGNGPFEFRCIIILGGTTPAAFQQLNKYKTVSRPELKTCNWLGINCWTTWSSAMQGEIIIWKKELYGSTMLYKWIEEDPKGNATESNVALTTSFKDEKTGGTYGVTSNVKITTKPDDKPLGEAFVEYCDAAEGEGYLYGGGNMLSFMVRHK